MFRAIGTGIGIGVRLFSSIPTRAPISITPAAWTKIQAIMETSDQKKGMLFSASSGGCNGFNYVLRVLDETTYSLINSERLKPSMLEDNGVRVYVDPAAEFYLLGTNIDYTTQDYPKGRFENKFVFTPDKDYATSCGCGVSFSPKASS